MDLMIDVLIVIAFVVYSVSVGFAMRKQASRGIVDYFLAGRSLKGWQAGISMAATQYAADTPLLVTGLVATAGIFSLWRLWIYALAFLLMGFVFGTSWRRAQILTDAELTEIRYSGRKAAWLRALKAIHMGTFVNCTVLAMVLLAATRIAEPFLLWHEWLPQGSLKPLAFILERFHLVFTTVSETDPTVWIRSTDNLISILLIVSFTTLYSATGGLRSVVATDVVQFAIAMIATGFYAWVIVNQIGGLGTLIGKITDLYGTEASKTLLSFGPHELSEVTFVFLLVLGIQWFAQVSADGTGYLAQRTMACKSDRDAKQAAIIFTVAQIFFRSLLWLPIALGLLVLYPASELPPLGSAFETFRMVREQTFATGIKDFLPVGLRGLMLTGMLAALASTVDTHLNWGASYWTNDLYKRFLMEEFFKRQAGNRELVWVARISNVVILLISLFLTAQISSIQTAWHLTLLFGSGLGMVLILRWIWYRINIWSEIVAVLISLVLSPILLIGFPNLDEGLRMFVMAALSTAGILIVTFLTPPESQEALQSFYLRVQPYGFWRPVALTLGKDPNRALRQFKRGVIATLTCAISIFCLLIGCGRLMIDVTSPSWVPIGLAGLGLFLIPIWWCFGFVGEGSDK